MALLWCDGFEGYGTTAGAPPSPTGVVADKYSYVTDESRLDVETSTRGGYDLQVTTRYYSSYLRTPELTSNDTMIAGVAVHLYVAASETAPTEYPLIAFRNALNGACADLLFCHDCLYVRDASSTLVGTSRTRVPFSIWQYVELKVYAHATAGTIDVRVNGCPVISLTSVNTINSTAAVKASLGSSVPELGDFQYSHMDDFYVCDGSGSTNNDFLGDVRVETLFPNGDSSVNFSTTGNASLTYHYEQVDNGKATPATDYVLSGGSGEKDVYDVANLTLNFTTVHAVVGWTYSQYDTATSDYQMVCDSNGTVSASGNITCASSWHTDSLILETDPDTSAAWEQAGVNACLWGFEVQ